MFRTLAFVIMAILISLTLSACDGGDEPTVRIVLVLDEGLDPVDLDAGLDEAVDVLEERLVAFDLAGAEVRREGEQVIIELPDSTSEDTIDAISRRGLLQFCEPVTDEAGNVAVVRGGTVQYGPQSCRPVRRAQGNIAVEGGSVEFEPWAPSDSPQAASNPHVSQIVWQPAKGKLGGSETELTSVYFEETAPIESPDTIFAAVNPLLLMFQWDDSGSDLSAQVTERLAVQNYPLAVFLDGEPVLGQDGTMIAPRVQSKITDVGVITGLSKEDVETLSTLLNAGALPLPLQVLETESP
jgi:hypothetical protein